MNSIKMEMVLIDMNFHAMYSVSSQSFDIDCILQFAWSSNSSIKQSAELAAA
jgi:hypothetical protein